MKADNVSDQIATVVLDALADIKAQNVLSLDVRSLTGIADYMIIASGTSSRHVKALADKLLAAVATIAFFLLHAAPGGPLLRGYRERRRGRRQERRRPSRDLATARRGLDPGRAQQGHHHDG